MKYQLYKILLAILNVLVFAKKGVFFCLKIIWHGTGKLNDIYTKTLGFRLYKIRYSLQKRFKKYRIPLDSRIVEVIGSRAALQICILIVAVLIMLPYSELYTKEIEEIPGRNTLLYQLVGPGDHEFGTDTVTIEKGYFADKQKKEDAAWKTGAITIEAPSLVGKEQKPVVQNITAITAGGTALMKPSILPGTELPTVEKEVDGTFTKKRRDVVVYTVQAGDVIGAIAERFGISVNTILWENNLSFRSYIRPGDTLRILPGTGIMHTVVRGDTVSKIANKYDTEKEKIVEANKLKRDGSDIVVGEKLFILGGIKPRTYRPVTRRRSAAASRVSAPVPSVNVPAGVNYVWPTSCRRITQYYGWRHTGIDVGCGWGAPLVASKAGRVVKSQCGWNGGYGCYVVLDHGGGVTTLYAHARRLYVSAGQRVSQGQTIAEMGSTGRSTGPHIHYEVRVNGRRQNPLKYVR